MKRAMLLASLAWGLGMPHLLGKSELETLRSLCAEQERQIRQLEDENAKLRSLASLNANRGGDKIPLSASPAAVPSSSATPAKTNNTYTVKSTDTLDKVSRKFGISAAALAAMNGLKATSTLHEGQKLKVPGNTSTAPAAATATTATPQAEAFAGKTHTVKDGETYYSIGKKYGIPINTLIEANPSIKASAMRTGQVIQLSKPATPPGTPEKATTEKPATEKTTTEKPATEKSTTEKPATEKSLASEKTATEKASAGDKPSDADKTAARGPVTEKKTPPAPEKSTTSTSKSNIRSVTIEATTTYGEFAAKHGTSISRLNDLNALDLVESTVLAKGSELYVPK